LRVYNYVRPLWSNGAHVVQDAPEPFDEALRCYFGKGPMSRFIHDDIQVARLPRNGLSVAWIMLEVELASDDASLSYRRARYLHVLASEERELDVASARRLFVEVYGPDLAHGIAAGQTVLQRLSYPEDAAEARDLFAGRPRATAPTCESRSEIERPAPAEAVSSSASIPKPEPEPLLGPATVGSGMAEAQALAPPSHESHPVEPEAPRLETSGRPATDDRAHAPKAGDDAPASVTSLSALLSGRLNDIASKTWPPGQPR
jgi:hypothetical protein